MSANPHVMIVEARFYEDIADELVRGAVLELMSANASHERFAVPGTFEVAAAVAMARDARPGEFAGFIALGCVIRGETSHYDYICAESARGLQDLAVRHGLAIGYGILTVEDRDQAWARASVDGGNKGGAAARAVLGMIALRTRLGTGG